MHNVTFVPSPEELVFYPIGNTPAVNLLSHHSPKTEKDARTEILSLACGDFRSILYSLWCEGKPGAEKFNFTCCDLEPAVLARNVLLFSLMLDNASDYASSPPESQNPKLATIWNACYHFFLSRQDLEVVQKQSLKLLSYSETLEKWGSGPFSCIKFVSQQTLDELRKIWTKYTERRSDVAEKAYKAARRSEIKANYNEYHVRPDGSSSASHVFYAGPHWHRGLRTAAQGIHRYWKHGVAGGSKADIEALGSDGKGISNPLFMVTSFSEEFKVHYATDPMATYHLTSVFDGELDVERVIDAMVTLAKLQFQQWSKAFVDHVQRQSVQVNIYYGDAITFCHEVAARSPTLGGSAVVTRLYTSQWSMKPLLFDGDAEKDLPSFFDVIDTSNLADFVGLCNVLPPVSQLLLRKDTSVLYTETLHLTAVEPDDDLHEALFMDVDLASLFIGVAPLGHLVGYSTENSEGENIVHLNYPNRYRIRVPWKAVLDHHTKGEVLHYPSEKRVYFDAEEPSEIFFEIYLKMFAQESIEAAMKKSKKGIRPMNSAILSRYSRLSFATLIQHTMRNITSDWKKFFALLLDQIEKDTTSQIGLGCMLDLVLQLSLSGAISNAFTKVDPNPNPRRFTQVTLVVPRSELAVFKKLGGAPGIHLDVMKNKNNNYFFAIDCFFGSIKQNNDVSWAEVVEDPTEWAGSSDLIVTTPVPPELVETGKFEVALLVTMSLHCSVYVMEIGPELCIFMTSNKSKRVFTSDGPPGIPKSRLENGKGNRESDVEKKLSELAVETAPHLDSQQEGHSLVLTGSCPTGPLIFKAKYTILEGTEEAIALSSGATISFPDNSPCSMLLKIGEKYSRRLIFPFLINPDKSKCRIARKSVWIEVTVPAASTLVPGGYDLIPFPVVIKDNSRPSGWSLPRVNLSRQPRIPSSDPGNWFANSFDDYLSIRENKIIDKGPDIPKSSPFRNVLPIFKKTLNQISMHVIDIPEMKVFVLAGPDTTMPVTDTMIVANCLRHGRETGSIILDAWVIPIDASRRAPFMKMMPNSSGKAQVFMIDDQEMFIWKSFFPAAVESCRRDWEHGKNCEYLKEKKVPLSTGKWKDPLCSCGQGKDVAEFPKSSFVKSMMKLATRVAIPTLSAVSCVEANDPKYRTKF